MPIEFYSQPTPIQELISEAMEGVTNSYSFIKGFGEFIKLHPELPPITRNFDPVDYAMTMTALQEKYVREVGCQFCVEKDSVVYLKELDNYATFCPRCGRQLITERKIKAE